MAVSLDNFSTLFSLTGRATRARAEQLLNGFGLHVGQQYILECLWEQDGLTVGELATRIRIELPTLTRAVSRMEPAGVVERRPDDHDHRRVRIWLTSKGRQLRTTLPTAMKKLEDELLADFSPAEREELVRLLRKLYTAAIAGDCHTPQPGP